MEKIKNKLLVIGSVNVDLSICTDNIPKQGETIYGNNFRQELGGKGVNQAFYAQLSGMNTTLFCSIGDDIFGQSANKKLNQTGLNLIIKKRKNKNTGVAVIIVNENDNRIILEHGANYVIEKKEIEELFSSFNGSYFLTQLETPFEIAKHSFILAKNKNITTFFNPTPAIEMEDDIYNFIDFIIVNETECETLCGIFPNREVIQKAAEWFLNKGVKNVIITLGSKGSYFYNKTQSIFVVSKKIKVVNTTGAGDSFIGAFISKLDSSNNIDESLKFATKIAGLVCESENVQAKDIINKI